VPEQANPVVELETSAGSMKIELYPDKAPDTVSNFLAYVDEGYYDGTIFHRVISNFMIQGGGFTADMREKETRDPVKNEADNGLGNERGAIAMARTSDPHSATAQFFINTVETNDFLNHRAKTSQGWGYCVFGKMTEGYEVLDKIRQVATGNSRGHQDVPVKPVTIVAVRRA
jgi:peptidyl-prolyl cis-trans isomerase B (cyclophilin B)